MQEADLAWYDELRKKYRPEKIRVLLIAESPPDPGEEEKRFFYAPTLSRYDNLFRGVAEALYGKDTIRERQKSAILKTLQADGFWLIDAVEQPINKHTRSLRRKAIRDDVSGLVRRCQQLAPSRGVVICHGLVYEQTAEELRAAAVNLLHRSKLPFPLGEGRARFVTGMREALGLRQTEGAG